MEKVLYQFHFNYINFLVCFIPLIVGLGSFSLWKWYPLQNPGVEVKGNRGHKGYLVGRTIGWIVGSLCFLLFSLSIISYIWEYKNIRNMINSNDLYTVEGYVENYSPLPVKGHGTEHFEIEGVYFEYSDFIVTNGYNNAASRGGVVTHNGQHLKIKYYKNNNNENVIVYIAELIP